MIPEVREHCPAVMRYQNPVRRGGPFQNLRIADTAQPGIDGGGEIDSGLLLPHRPNDVKVEIGIRLKANAQLWDSPILALARWIFSQSTGLACSRGIPLESNSRSVSSRYLSIAAL